MGATGGLKRLRESRNPSFLLRVTLIHMRKVRLIIVLSLAHFLGVPVKVRDAWYCGREFGASD